MERASPGGLQSHQETGTQGKISRPTILRWPAILLEWALATIQRRTLDADLEDDDEGTP